VGLHDRQVRCKQGGVRALLTLPAPAPARRCPRGRRHGRDGAIFWPVHAARAHIHPWLAWLFDSSVCLEGEPPVEEPPVASFSTLEIQDGRLPGMLAKKRKHAEIAIRIQ
jgi:hypothetical protein